MADESGKQRILLEPYAYRWYRVGGGLYVGIEGCLRGLVTTSGFGSEISSLL